MPSNATAKTASAPKSFSLAVLIVAGLVLLGTVAWWHMLTPKIRTLRAGGQTYHLEIATTDGARERGLSGRQSMPQHDGMLFVFQREEQLCFWMKGMKFPLDMIWTDASRRVVFLAEQVSPDTYPRKYCSGDTAAYVIELNAGEVRKSGIHKGQVLNF